MSIETQAIEEPQKNSIWTFGFALFSMFFGAGNLVFPLLVGKNAGAESASALAGLSLSAVAFPFLGLAAILLYGGNLKLFLARLGKWPAAALLFILAMSQGPIGACPRLITLMHASVKPYWDLSLPIFSIFVSALVFFLTVRPTRMMKLLGVILTPLLIATLALLFSAGLLHGPQPLPVPEGALHHFKEGLQGGYQTLDLTAALLFGALMIPHLSRGGRSSEGEIRKSMLGASAVAAGLLMVSYIGLCYLSASYGPLIPAGIEDVDYLHAIAVQILGPSGGLLATGAVFLACLTTAISLAAIFSDYLRTEFFKGRGGTILPLGLTLVATALMANLGFSGIMKIWGPILEILYPSLIVLCLLNIANRLFAVRMVKTPVFAALAFGSASFIFL
jgi:LIVCS family branched-chain amino acid:cation transporter